MAALVAEYKPAFGAIFAAHLKPYTHWGTATSIW